MFNTTPRQRVSVTATILAVSVMGDSMLYGVLPANLGDFGLTAGLGAGLVLSANRWIRLISNSWAASIYNRFGLRIPLMISVILAMATTISYGLFQGFWPLLVARIGWGICFSIQIISLYMVVLREGEEYRGALMGVYNSLFRFGSLVAVIAGGLLVDTVGIRMAFAMVAFVAVSCLPVVLLIEEDGPISGKPLEGSNVYKGNKDKGGGDIWTMLLGTRSDKLTHNLKLLAVNYTRFTNTFAVSGIVMATLGLLIRHRIGEFWDFGGLMIGAATLTGLILAPGWASEVGLSIYFGRMSDRFGRRSVLLICLPVVVFGSLALIAANISVLILVVPLIFAATTASKVSLDALAGDLSSGADRAHVMSRYATWADLGAALGPVAGYTLISVIGLSAIYTLSALVVASGLVFYVVTNK